MYWTVFKKRVYFSGSILCCGVVVGKSHHIKFCTTKSGLNRTSFSWLQWDDINGRLVALFSRAKSGLKLDFSRTDVIKTSIGCPVDILCWVGAIDLHQTVLCNNTVIRNM